MRSHVQFQDDQQDRIRKSLWLSGGVTFFFLILLARLFYVQVILADVNIRLSKENQMSLKTLKAPRGRMFDRTGEVLARNRPSYSINVVPYRLTDQPRVTENLLKIRGRDGEPVFDSLELLALITKARYRRFDATRLKEDVPIDIVSIIEEHALELPGITVGTEARREYPLGGCSFHALGYMSEIPEDKFDSLKELGYHYGDLIGKAGLEKQYESVFRGVDGREYIEVNAYGKSLGPIENMPRSDPVAGHDVYLTLDARLQEAAAAAFVDSLRGAVVAVDPRNGEVLVMFSSPAVDPNIFSLSTALRAKNWAEVARDPAKPLNNRATSGTYEPGSTFKLVTAASGLAEGVIAEGSSMRVPCTGGYRFGNRLAKCWSYPRGHGRLNTVGAVQRSCNVYFYQLGLLLDDEPIVRYAKLFGLGQETGIDLPHERVGYLSGEEAHNQRFAKRIKTDERWSWTRGLILNMAIGQSQTVTPLQLALMVGGMAHGKAVYKPFLLKEVRSREGIVISQTRPEVLHELDLDESVIATMRKAMLAVTDPTTGGTGRRARVPGIPVGGKTGSAENPHGDKTHGLFVGCAPVDNPVIAIAVVVENAGHGGTVAAPVAGAVMQEFFKVTDEGKMLVEHYEQEREKEKRGG
jgi:penicillin-binding protein 2